MHRLLALLTALCLLFASAVAEEAAALASCTSVEQVLSFLDIPAADEEGVVQPLPVREGALRYIAQDDQKDPLFCAAYWQGGEPGDEENLGEGGDRLIGPQPPPAPGHEQGDGRPGGGGNQIQELAGGQPPHQVLDNHSAQQRQQAQGPQDDGHGGSPLTAPGAPRPPPGYKSSCRRAGLWRPPRRSR